LSLLIPGRHWQTSRIWRDIVHHPDHHHPDNRHRASSRAECGKSFGVFGCSNTLVNYPSLVVASVPGPNQITATAGPGGTIPSQTVTNPAGAKGSIYFRERFGRARNGVSQIFESATVTNSSLYVRSESGRRTSQWHSSWQPRSICRHDGTNPARQRAIPVCVLTNHRVQNHGAV
jgi:hypothetical protein